MGYVKLNALRAEVDAEVAERAEDLEQAVEPVDIPPEVFEDEGDLDEVFEALADGGELPSEVLVSPEDEPEPDPPPLKDLAPEPSLGRTMLMDLKSLKMWMDQEPNVSAISLTREGKLSVSMCYHFNLEDLNG